MQNKKKRRRLGIGAWICLKVRDGHEVVGKRCHCGATNDPAQVGLDASGETPLHDCTGLSDTFPLLLFPSWLLQDPEMKLRTTYKGFTEAVDAYFDRLMRVVVPFQASTILSLSLGVAALGTVGSV